MRRIALLFPGQGAQAVGMGRAAAARFPEARAVFDRIDAALRTGISALCWDGPAERLQETRLQQPAIFACSMALWAAWRAGASAEDGDEVVCAAGHSLGEYCALVAAGALSLEDGAVLVAARGEAMQHAAERRPGAMAAVLGLNRQAAVAICAEASDPAEALDGVVVLANDNAPGQQVLSGAAPALARAVALAKARGARRIVPLKVAGAFHSPLMQSAAPQLAAALAAARIERCAIPVIANSTCEPLAAPEEIGSELLRQLTAPVRWVESVEALARYEPDLWVDCGPGNVVAGLVGRILAAARTQALSSTIDAPDPAA